MDLASDVVTAMRTGAMQGLATRIDAAGAGASLAIYGNTRPAAGATAGAAALVKVTLAYPCGTVSAGVLTLADTAFAQILNGGDPVWARIEDADDVWLGDFSVGTQAMHTSNPATAEVILEATHLYTGAFLALIGAQIAGN